MSSPATVIDAAPRPAALAAAPTSRPARPARSAPAGPAGPAAPAASADQATQVRHSKSCPARQIGGACEPWCRAFPCPAWCTGAHRAGNPVYHLAAPCPPGCAGHPNWDTEADFGDYHGGVGDSAATRSAQAG
jgi:hypothetical protein